MSFDKTQFWTITAAILAAGLIAGIVGRVAR